MQLRGFQDKADKELDVAYAQGAKVVMLVIPTGGGKTVMFTHRIAKFPGISMMLAHRAELVSQASLTLAKRGIMHRVLGPQSLVKKCAKLHMMKLKKHFIGSNANVICASVQTLDHKDFATRYPVFANMLPNVGQWICDEGHHLLEENMWGRVVQKMPNAIGLVPTATPERADGKGLGRHADGLVDDMVVGPTQRELIDWGFLTDYDIYAPDPSLDLEDVDVSAKTGDFNQEQLRNASHKQSAKLVGDLVQHYMTWAMGKLTICFVTDLETAASVCEGFNVCGIKAAVVSSKTDDLMRAQIMQQFEEGFYRVVVNVDILGEGVDVPAVECVLMGRPTESFSLFNQQAGRALRTLEGKDRAIIIDAVGNIKRHARVVEYDDGRTLIDLSRGEWTLDSRSGKAGKSRDLDDLKLMRCNKCTKSYAGSSFLCPHCGYDNAPEPNERNIENVDGDLTLLTPEQLAASQEGKITQEQQFKIDAQNCRNAASRLTHSNQQAAIRQHKNANEYEEKAKRSVQVAKQLENAMLYFGGYYEAQGKEWGEIYRRFYNRYGVDVLSAQKLSMTDAETLCLNVCEDLAKRKI